MNYEKLTAGLSKEEIKAIYNNWSRRFIKIAYKNICHYMNYDKMRMDKLQNDLRNRFEYFESNYDLT